MGHRQDQPSENENGIVDSSPDPLHGLGRCFGEVDVVRQEDYDAETGKPGKVDDDFDGGSDLGQ